MNIKTRQTHHKGAALVTSLILLMALTMVSLSAVQSTSVQVQISGNDEATMTADQYAQSVVDAVINNSTNFVVGASPGYTVCAVTDPNVNCNQLINSLTDPMFNTASVGVNPSNGVQAKVTLVKTGTAPRLGASASSATQFNGAYFNIIGSYDKPDGKATVVQGFVMIVNKT